MIEDSALSLKKKYENGSKINLEKARKMLENSELIKRLISEPARGPETFVGLRGYEWRLLELSEIPFTYTLGKVQEWLKMLVEKTYFAEGFSLSGDKDGLLSCHNAMISTILMKMNYQDRTKIDTGINWILKYQNIERGQESNWTGKDLYSKYGGCMKNTPCYYGVVKSMIALTEYKKRFNSREEINTKLKEGLEYILEHNIYKKLSTGEPIESSIIKNFYPYPYKTNLIEILSLLKENDLLDDPGAKEAIEILKGKKRDDGYWQVDATYMKSSWVEFDKPKKAGLWISYVISNLLSN